MRTLLLFLARNYATCGFIGYMPSSGTMATLLVGVPTALLWYRFLPDRKLRGFILLSAITVTTIMITAYALPSFGGLHDPSAIVIDEVIGFLWALWRRPRNKKTVAIGFLAFRFFDITKWGLVGLSEYLPGATGIIMDDVVAGLFANFSIWTFA